MLTVITVSLNRALQLDTHLNSFLKNVQCDGAFHHYVVYGATSQEFSQGYEKLKEKFKDTGIIFVKNEKGLHRYSIRKMLIYPRNFYRYLKYPYYRSRKELFNFESIIIDILENSNDEYIMFTTDDSYFYKEFYIKGKIFDLISQDHKHNFFNGWAGENIGNLPKSARRIDNEIITWDLDDKTCNRYWSYHFSIDACIYHRRTLLTILKKVLFINPNTLEGNVQFYAAHHNYFNRGFCYVISPWVMFSLNQVQNIGHHLDVIVIDTKYLNDMYIKGYELRFEFDGPPKIIDSKADKVYLTNGIEEIILYEK